MLTLIQEDDEEIYFCFMVYLLCLLYHKDDGPVHLASLRHSLEKQ